MAQSPRTPHFCHLSDVSRPNCSLGLLLTRICSKWKEIAVYTPKQWSSLRLHIVSPKIFQGVTTNVLFLLSSTMRNCGWRDRGHADYLSLYPWTNHMRTTFLQYPTFWAFLYIDLEASNLFPQSFWTSQVPERYCIWGDLPEVNVFSILKQAPSIRKVTVGTR